jgi:hypothetical protein
MPGWAVSVGLAVLVVLLLLAFGSVELVTVLVILFAWFFVLSSVALSFETLTQAIGRRLRRR